MCYIYDRAFPLLTLETLTRRFIFTALSVVYYLFVSVSKIVIKEIYLFFLDKTKRGSPNKFGFKIYLPEKGGFKRMMDILIKFQKGSIF